MPSPTSSSVCTHRGIPSTWPSPVFPVATSRNCFLFRAPATACLDVVAENLAIVRAHVPVPVVLENITYYFTWPQDEYDDLSFLMRALDESGAFLLLDLENLRINAVNHGLDPVAFIDALPPGIVRAIHVAGEMREGPVHIDTHNRPVGDDVLQLLARTLLRQVPDAIIVERDDRLEAFDQLVADCRRVRSVVAALDLSSPAPAAAAD